MLGQCKRWIARFNLAVASFLFAVVAIYGNVSLAKDQETWPVEGKLLGKVDKKSGKTKKSEDVSGVACAETSGFPRTCLIIDDNIQAAQVVIIQDGKLTAGSAIPLIENVFSKGGVKKPLEFDGEGVAFADGAFYIIGSHGHPRDKERELDPIEAKAEIDARIKASSQLIRVRFGPGTIQSDGTVKGSPEIVRTGALHNALAREPALARTLHQRLDRNGLTIEGVAVRDGRLYAGMRAPLLDGGDAAVLSANLDALFDGKPLAASLHRLKLGPGRGVRDLTSFGNGFLVLAGLASDLPKADPGLTGDYAIYWWDGATSLKLLKELDPYSDEDGDTNKPEALLPLDQKDGKLRVLLFFDGPDEGAPRPVEVDHP
jgi:hypothetical protein